MKHIILIALLITQSICMACVAQESKVNSQATQWFGIQYHHDYPQSKHTPIITRITYNLGPDTLINAKQYRKIRYTNESKKVTNSYRGAIRQSQNEQQVYFVPCGSNNEYLLYDFDVKQGDTVYAYAGFYDNSCVEMVEFEQNQSVTPAWIVKDVQIVDGRKHVQVQFQSNMVEWIEGIGTKHILWSVGRGCYATGMEIQFQHTLCAADNESNTIYSFDTDYIGIRNNCPEWDVLAQAQQSTYLYFEDKNGVKDSLQVVIAQSNEDISTAPPMELAEVKQAIMDSTYFIVIRPNVFRQEFYRTYTYTPYGGYIENRRKDILIPADRLPVTITWDKQFFMDTELLSVLSDMPCWFDVGCRDQSMQTTWLAKADTCIVYNSLGEDMCTYEYLDMDNGEVIVKNVGFSIGTKQNLDEAIEHLETAPSATKVLRDGQILILRNGKTYTMQGQEVK